MYLTYLCTLYATEEIQTSQQYTSARPKLCISTVGQHRAHIANSFVTEAVIPAAGFTAIE